MHAPERLERAVTIGSFAVAGRSRGRLGRCRLTRVARLPTVAVSRSITGEYRIILDRTLSVRSERMKKERTSWGGLKVGLLLVLTVLTMGSSGGCPREWAGHWGWWAPWFGLS